MIPHGKVEHNISVAPYSSSSRAPGHLMNNVISSALFFGGVVGSIIMALHLYGLPHQLFLRDARWLSGSEFCKAYPAQAWCRYVPAISLCFGFVTQVIFFVIVMSTCTNKMPMVFCFLPLYILWIQLPIGFVELVAGASVFVPFGRGRGLSPSYMADPRVIYAGILRLCMICVIVAGFLTAAYW